MIPKSLDQALKGFKNNAPTLFKNVTVHQIKKMLIQKKNDGAKSKNKKTNNTLKKENK